MACDCHGSRDDYVTTQGARLRVDPISPVVSRFMPTQYSLIITLKSPPIYFILTIANKVMLVRKGIMLIFYHINPSTTLELTPIDLLMIWDGKSHQHSFRNNVVVTAQRVVGRQESFQRVMIL